MPFKPMQYLAPCKILRISENEKLLLVKFGILRFGIRNSAQGIRNSATLGIWNLSIDSRNLESKLYWLQESGIQNPSLRKQTTFRDATTGFPVKWRLRKEHRNSILMTRHYQDLGSASDWLKKILRAARPIRSATQIWVITRRHYRICALVSQTSFRGEISGSVAKRRLISQATRIQDCLGWTHLERNIWPSVIHT